MSTPYIMCKVWIYIYIYIWTFTINYKIQTEGTQAGIKQNPNT